MGGGKIENWCVFGYGAFGANGVQVADEVEEVIGFRVLIGFDFGVIFGRDLDVFEGVFFEEEFELVPIVVSSVLVVGIFEGVHGDFTGFVAGDDFSDEEAVGHVFSVVFDGVGQIEALHPLDNISGESAFGMEVVHGLSGLFVVRVDGGFHG